MTTFYATKNTYFIEKKLRKICVNNLPSGLSMSGQV